MYDAPLDWSCPIDWAHPLNRGLLGWWLCVPGAMGGTTLKDLCKRTDGTLKSMDPATDWITSPVRTGGRGALDFDGTNDYVTLGATSKLDINGEMSVAAWFNSRTVLAGARTMIANYAAGGTSSDYGLFLNRAAAKVRFEWAGTFDTNHLDSALSVSANTWYHAVATRSGVSGAWVSRIYINGVLNATSGTLTGNPDASSVETTIGRGGATGAFYWSGMLDDIRLWGRALGPSEAMAVYQDSLRSNADTLNRIRQRRGIKAPSGNRRRRLLLCGGAA